MVGLALQQDRILHTLAVEAIFGEISGRRAAAKWVDEMSSLEEEYVRLRQEIARLQKIEEAAKEYQLTKNITWRLELFRLVKEGG